MLSTALQVVPFVSILTTHHKPTHKKRNSTNAFLASDGRKLQLPGRCHADSCSYGCPTGLPPTEKEHGSVRCWSACLFHLLCETAEA